MIRKNLVQSFGHGFVLGQRFAKLCETSWYYSHVWYAEKRPRNGIKVLEAPTEMRYWTWEVWNRSNSDAVRRPVIGVKLLTSPNRTRSRTKSLRFKLSMESMCSTSNFISCKNWILKWFSIKLYDLVFLFRQRSRSYF